MKSPLLRWIGLSFALGTASCGQPAPEAAPRAPTARGPKMAENGALQRMAVERAAGLAAEGPRLFWADRSAAPLSGADARAAALRATPGLLLERGHAGPAVEALQPFAAVALEGGGLLLRQRAVIDGLEVQHSEVAIVLDGQRRLVGHTLGAAFDWPLSAGPKGAARLGLADAVALAVEDRVGVQLPAGALRSPAGKAGAWRSLPTPTALGLRWAAPPRARELLVNGDDGLQHAIEVEVQVGVPGEPAPALWRLTLSAETGAVLRRERLTHDVDYRVWAEPSGDLRPLDGPLEDMSPHPTAVPDSLWPGAVSSVLVSVDGLNHPPGGGPADPWLPAGATTTNGNNVEAYSDAESPDGLGGADTWAPASGPDAFDWAYDLSLEPLADAEQRDAAIVQAFYTTNWLHDWFYDSGFDEANGVAQLDNYGRGGIDGDPMKVELQDGALAGSRNNANMSTPADGSRPRMQIFLWDGARRSSLSTGPDGVDYAVSTASFGPTDFALSAPLALPGGDGRACSAPSVDLSGQVALVDRGDCTFVQKALSVQAAGAVGLIIANNTSGGPPSMGTSTGGNTVTIGIVGISQADGAALRAAMAAGEAEEATLLREDAPTVDGGLDNSVIAHEWGHYLYGRLGACGANQCSGINEGWADFIALHMMLRPGDDRTGAFAPAPYAASGSDDDATYYGVRRVPYSIDPALNALSFRHIGNGEALPTTHPMASGSTNNAQVHNTGEIWATAAFEAYVALHDAAEADGRPFEDVQRRMSDILVAGRAAAPTDPTFTELRDALLMVAAAIEPADAEVMAAAFARRGLGSCAVSPARDSSDHAGVVEDFDLRPELALSGLTISDAPRSCDDDGVLDGGELGEISVLITNNGGAPLTLDRLVFTPSAAVPGLTMPEGDSLVVPPIAPFSSLRVALPLFFDRHAAAPATLAWAVRAEAAEACTTEAELSAFVHVEGDPAPRVSARDDFEVNDGSWTLEGDGAAEIWGHVLSETGEGSLLGVDLSGITDTSAASPPFLVSATDPLRLNLRHRYKYEQSDGTDWDGGVIELRVDGGDWADLADWVDPGYTGTLTTRSDNPLGDRRAFTGQSAAWPAFEDLSVDLGGALAGSTVELRLRIGTDQSVGDVGWEIDAIELEGIDDLPFSAWLPDATDCNPAPVAEAGPEQRVEPEAAVALDGTGSSDPDGEPLSFAWVQLAGPAVALDDPSAAAPRFTAPVGIVEAEQALVFELTVSDDALTDADTVRVVVAAAPPPLDSGEPGGEGADGEEGGEEPILDEDTGAPAAASPAGDGKLSGCACSSEPTTRGALRGIGWLALPAAVLGLRRRRR